MLTLIQAIGSNSWAIVRESDSQRFAVVTLNASGKCEVSANDLDRLEQAAVWAWVKSVEERAAKRKQAA